jgi:NADH:ubiquinone oxidoreductase subunit 2 (chain N)
MNEFLLAAPIVSIAILAIVSIVFDAINPKNSNFGFAFALISLFVGLAFSVVGLINSPQWLEYFATTVQDGKTFAISFEQALKMGETLSYNTLSFSKSAYYFDILFLIGAIFTMFASRPYLQREKAEASEYYNLILYAVAGMMIIAHTNHMLTAFIGIETMSITFYILAGYFRFNKKSVEAALKYFLLGAFATGFLVYGMAMIYGGTGSFDLDVISTAISTGNVNSVFYVNIGLAMMIIGLAFKIAAFPFINGHQMYTQDHQQLLQHL